ncbi:MAG: S8 family peptidase [Magnetococcales bacterium]|nr:S8 family peptidase [Magnetococcales bacterium]
MDSPDQKPHLHVQKFGEEIKYGFPSTARGKQPPWPQRNRNEHGTRIQTVLAQAVTSAKEQARIRLVDVNQTSVGYFLLVECVTHPNFSLKSLEIDSRGIQLMSVTPIDSDRQLARIFVPFDAQEIYQEKIRVYLDETDLTRTGKPKNQFLVEGMEDIKPGNLLQLWTHPEEMPNGIGEFWWEVWAISVCFEEMELALERLSLSYRGKMKFPDRIVINIRASIEQMEILCLGVGGVAELRKPTTVPYFFLEQLSKQESQDWAQELVNRTEVPSSGTSYICLLDTGVNRAHYLIEPFLTDEDSHTWGTGPLWPKSDNHEFVHAHGTPMAGLALFGDLTYQLESTDTISINHRLESVRILPRNSSNDEKDYGPITEGAVSLVEIEVPPSERNRVFCMAITGDSGLKTGQPTPWSATVDNLCFPDEEEANPGRLFVISAGNIREKDPVSSYLDRNQTTSIEDPAQAWNALTVGAITEKWEIVDPSWEGWNPLADRGCLNPGSRTSCSWDNIWPLKPDIVLEGGNWAESPTGTEWDTPEDLQLLTTHPDISKHAFTTINDTSAATALASRLVAQVQYHFPNYWPETIRALIVHSAEWTDTMKEKISGKNKSQIRDLVRMFGFGVPDLNRALWSAQNRLNLIIEDTVIPFHDNGGMKEMRFYALPWPKEVLENLDQDVQLRITLSYFIKGNPSQRGYKGRYSYASHGLRFRMKRPLESVQAFLKRISKAQREDGYKPDETSGSDQWLLGIKNQEKGSLHSDIWEGPGAELAECGFIAVHPVTGWWKEGRHKVHNKPVRFSLIVSLQTDSEMVDLYTPVATIVEQVVETPIEV